ncbi:MAG: hypothetical protein CMJ48_09545 [Planctomycetaceae bacterium]|nr:hypothetical protein [Planctomycetaceae bacterium]
MGPFCFRGIALAVLVCALVGCSNPPKMAELSLFSWRPGAKVAKTDDEAATGDDKDALDAFGPSGVGETKDDAKSEQTSVAESKPSEDPATNADANAAGGVVSGDLLTQIEETLPDATPEDRAEVFERLKTVDPSFWPTFLQTYRMARDVAKRQVAQSNSGSDPGVTQTGRQFTPNQATVAEQGRYPQDGPLRQQAGPSQVGSGSSGAGMDRGWGEPPLNQPRRDQWGSPLPYVQPRQDQIAANGYDPSRRDGRNGDYESRRSDLPRDPQQYPGVPNVRSGSMSSSQQPQNWQNMPVGTDPRLQAGVSNDFGNRIVQTAGGPSTNSSGARYADYQVQQNLQQVANSGIVVPGDYPGVRQTGIAISGDGSDGFDPQWRDTLQQLIRMAEQDVTRMGEQDVSRWDPRRRESFLAKHAYLRLLYLMADRPGLAMVSIPFVDEEDDEFWKRIVWGITSYFDATQVPNASERATFTIIELNNAIAALQTRAALSLKNLTFCSEIKGYGMYESFPIEKRYSHGDTVLLYVEVENFASEMVENGLYQTKLASTIEIYTAGNVLVAQQPFPDSVDLCKNRRRDYFHSYKYTLPKNLGPGGHVLKLTVEDLTKRRVVTATKRFTVE